MGAPKCVKGELVRYQVKAKNSNVADATVIIKDATGLPLYELTTDAFGFTQQVSLPSDFLLDRNWNHHVARQKRSHSRFKRRVRVNPSMLTRIHVPMVSTTTVTPSLTMQTQPPTMAQTVWVEIERCPSTPLKPSNSAAGTKDLSYVLSGPVDDIINLDNLRPGVTVNEIDGTSFATTVTLTGQAWDGAKWPYANDNTAIQKQFWFHRSR